MKPIWRYLILSILLASTSALAVAQEYVLAVNEGVTYHDDALPINQRYKPLLELLEKELKHPVRVQAVDRYSDFEKGLEGEKYDFAFIHPAHVGLRATRNGKYVGLATAKDYTEYRARVMVLKDSPLHSMDELRNVKKIGVPSLESITTVMFAASMKEMGVSDPQMRFTSTRYQDAVPFMVENKFVEAGVTASGAIVKEWTAKGGRVIGETKPIPIKQFLASVRFNAEQREKIRALMLRLSETESGKLALKAINMKGFVPWNDALMDDAAKRLGL